MRAAVAPRVHLYDGAEREEPRRMNEQERIDWRQVQAEVDARRADVLAHVAHCADCLADLRCENSGRRTCTEVGAIMRAWEHALRRLAELLIPTV